MSAQGSLRGMDPAPRRENAAGIGGHAWPVRGITNEWLTPPEILSALGPFDLDPCATVGQASRGEPWPTAQHMETVQTDGFAKPWYGRVWLNPPYGPETERWLAKLATHKNGIALIFARTETQAFHRQVWGRARAVLFLEGRLNFHHADGRRALRNAGGPSCLVAYGEGNVHALLYSGLPGTLVTAPWRRPEQLARKALR